MMVISGTEYGDLIDEVAKLLDPVPQFDPTRQVSVEMIARQKGWDERKAERELNKAVKLGKLRKVPVLLPSGRRGNGYEIVKP